MPSLPYLLKRIAKMDRREIACRLSQTTRRRIERISPHGSLRHLSDRRLSRSLKLDDPGASNTVSPERWLEHLRTRSRPLFFPLNEAMSADSSQTLSRESIERRIAAAGRILAGEFDLLGYEGLQFGTPQTGLRWNYDPVNGVETPPIFHASIDYLDPAVAGDSKIIWELSRFQFTYPLGQAWQTTGGEQYAEAWFMLVEDWLRCNPPGIGINWCSSLELAFRSISWLWGMHYFIDSSACTPERAWELLRQFVIHGRRINAYLSYYFAPNTHLLGEALALFYLGVMLPEYEEAHQWLSTGANILLAESEKQIRPDGGYFEQSTCYHRYALDFYHQFIILSRLNAIDLPDELLRRVELMNEFAMHAMLPDGRLPMLGDADGGRALMLDGSDINDIRPALSTGAVIFNRPDFKHAAQEFGEESYNLLGRAGAEAFAGMPAQPPQHTARHSPDTGWFFTRTGWSESDSFLYFDCGPMGMGPGGHAHADALGFELNVSGRPLIIDPGTFNYTALPEWREYFRSTFAHNTATVNGVSQAEPAAPFKWEKLPETILNASHLGSRLDFIDAQHHGYRRLPDPVTHRRRVLFVKPDYWLIVDTFTATGEHEYNITFTLASANAVLDVESLVVQTRDSGLPNCTIVPVSDCELQADIVGSSEKPIRGWVSYNYGSRQPAAHVRYHFRASGCCHIAFVLFPQKPDDAVPVAAEFVEVSRPTAAEKTGGEFAVKIDMPGTHDHVIVSGAANRFAEAGDMQSKAEAAVIRVDDSGEAKSCCGVNGSMATWRGVPLFDADSPADEFGV